MTLFLSHVNYSTTKTIQNIFISLRAIKVLVIRPKLPQKLVYEKFYVHEQILRTRNCPRKFIKNLLPEKRKENM